MSHAIFYERKKQNGEKIFKLKSYVFSHKDVKHTWFWSLLSHFRRSNETSINALVFFSVTPSSNISLLRIKLLQNNGYIAIMWTYAGL